MTRRAGTIVLLLVLGSTLVTGCTARQSEDQYGERLRAATSVRDEVVAQVDARRLDTPVEYREAAERLDAAADALDSDPPPRAVDAGHEPMIAGMRQLAAVLRRLERCARLEQGSMTAAAQCRARIGQQVFDEVRGDFVEADTIYGKRGFSVAGTERGSGRDDVPEGGDEL